MNTEDILQLRKTLHNLAEASMQEYRTKQTLMNFLKENTGLQVEDRGSWFYCFKEGKEGGAFHCLPGRF